MEIFVVELEFLISNLIERDLTKINDSLQESNSKLKAVSKDIDKEQVKLTKISCKINTVISHWARL